MPVLWITSHFGSCEGFDGHSSILELEVWHDIDCIVCYSQYIWPEIWSDGTGPPVMGVDEHCTCNLLKFPDLPLSNAILVMHCDSGKGEALSLL